MAVFVVILNTELKVTGRLLETQETRQHTGSNGEDRRTEDKLFNKGGE